jgi:hypothetical protein
MSDVQLTISEAERDLLVSLLTSAQKSKRVEVHRAEFSRDYREHLEREEALIETLCDKLSHAANTQA